MIRQRDLGEADRIVTLFTQERGKLSAVAKGVKRPRSKLASALQLFVRARIQLAAGRSLEVVTQVDPVALHYHLRDDVNRYAHACYVAELVDVLTEEGAPDGALFQLVAATLDGLDGGADPATLVRGFELKLLGRLGYGPELETCVSCDAKVMAGRAGFSVAQGGVLCRRCLRREGGGTLSSAAREAMRDLLEMSQEDLGRRRLSQTTRQELQRVMRAFVDYRLERQLRSAAFLAQ